MSAGWLDDDIVELQGAVTGNPGFYMQYVRDPASGAYLMPRTSAEQEAFGEMATKAAAWLAYREQPGATEEAFEAAWPEEWRELRTPRDEPANEVFALFDTGMVYEHPLLRGRIIGEAPFSGESDAVDHNGHGTIVALLYRAGMNRLPAF